jgi:hypothetical protein
MLLEMTLDLCFLGYLDRVLCKYRRESEEECEEHQVGFFHKAYK